MLNMNVPPMIYCVKYVDRDGLQKLEDISAVGSTDAQDKAREKWPGCRIINVWRKS